MRIYKSIAFLLFLAFTTLASGQTLNASSAGLNGASFGMTIDAVEKALGTKLSISGPRNRLCGVATIKGVSGLNLRFREGRFIDVEITNPAISTKSGFRVGSAEKDVINKFRRDPTYERWASPDGNGVYEIALGKRAFVGKDSSGHWQGRVMKISSKRGVVVRIDLGEAVFLMIDEHEGEQC